MLALFLSCTQYRAVGWLFYMRDRISPHTPRMYHIHERYFRRARGRKLGQLLAQEGHSDPGSLKSQIPSARAWDRQEALLRLAALLRLTTVCWNYSKSVDGQALTKVLRDPKAFAS